MRNLCQILLMVLIFGCAKQKEVPIHQRISNFEVSECRTDCWIDSVGVRTSMTNNGDLKVKLGYILNCSWKNGYLKNITEQHDTLILQLDRPHSEDGEYPMTSCDCFFYFDFVIQHYNKTPRAVRVADLFEKNTYWDERDFNRYEIEEVEEIIIEDK